VAIKTWKSKNGRVQYPLPNCKICGKRSNTSDKETAQMAERTGRICQACTRRLTREGLTKDTYITEKKSIWQKIKGFFK